MSQNASHEWLELGDHPAIDVPRWHHICQLLCQLFKASGATVAQYLGNEAKLMTVRQVKNIGLVEGSVENIYNLKARLSNPTLPSSGIWQHGLIELPLYWPGGVPFGAVLLVCDFLPPNLESCQMLASPMLGLLQSELKSYQLARQIERMSLQDETTQMLNRHGFNLMAPRQLSLSRRLGSHAGIVVMENGVQYGPNQSEEKIKALSQVVYDNLRVADVAARIGSQIVLLAFVDSQANLDALVSRLRKQFVRQLEAQRVLTGYRYFTPDSHLEITPMLAAANADLDQNRARLYPKANLSTGLDASNRAAADKTEPPQCDTRPIEYEAKLVEFLGNSELATESGEVQSNADVSSGDVTHTAKPKTKRSETKRSETKRSEVKSTAMPTQKTETEQTKKPTARSKAKSAALDKAKQEPDDREKTAKPRAPRASKAAKTEETPATSAKSPADPQTKTKAAKKPALKKTALTAAKASPPQAADTESAP